MALQHFNRDIEALKKQFLLMFAMVEESLQKSMQSFLDRDVLAAEQVAVDDKRVDVAEVGVEEECLKILALHQPIAQDLRYVVSVLKINRDLERIGDQAAAIARITMAVSDRTTPDLPELRPLMDHVMGMLKRAFDSVINLDVEQARQVWNEDDRADELAQSAIRRIETLLVRQPSAGAALLPVYSLVFVLERIGDHAANIAKDVLYTVLGEIVRHRGRDFKRPAAPPAV